MLITGFEPVQTAWKAVNQPFDFYKLARPITPFAVTIVAACINADTGVGPSIAIGNHVCKPNCADLPIAAITIPNNITSSLIVVVNTVV